nr:MAG TPA: hypothetical protein [Caudoviricetes sp.]
MHEIENKTHGNVMRNRGASAPLSTHRLHRRGND